MALVIIVVSVGLTTFVCSTLGKYCTEKLLTRNRERKSRSSGSARSCCHHRSKRSPHVVRQGCSRCDERPRALPLSGKPKHDVVVRINDEDEMIELNTFGPGPTSAQGCFNPSFAGGESAPNETFMRLGIPRGNDGIGSSIQQPFLTGEFSPVAHTCGIKGEPVNFRKITLTCEN